MIAWEFSEVVIGMTLQDAVLMDGFVESRPSLDIFETSLIVALHPVEFGVDFIPSAEYYPFVTGLDDGSGNWLTDCFGNILSI